MPSSFAAKSGLSLTRTPSHRQESSRRRLALFCALAGLALASGVIGSLVRPAPETLTNNTAMGPFSYFPSQ
jgi:hypothetical protein